MQLPDTLFPHTVFSFHHLDPCRSLLLLPESNAPDWSRSAPRHTALLPLTSCYPLAVLPPIHCERITSCLPSTTQGKGKGSRLSHRCCRLYQRLSPGSLSLLHHTRNILESDLYRPPLCDIIYGVTLLTIYRFSREVDYDVVVRSTRLRIKAVSISFSIHPEIELY